MLQLIVALLVSGSPADVTSLSLLDGRLIADFPRSAKIVSRSPEGIMGAPRSQATETRVIVDRGAERLVVLCEELMRTAGADFDQQVRAGASDGKDPYGTLKVLPRSRPDVIRLTPATLDPNGEAILLERVLFTSRDGTIQKLQFFVNPAGFKNADHWRQVVDTIRESLRVGTRQLERSKRTARLAGAGLSIDVPSQHVLSLRKAADFQLYDLEQITPYGAAVGDMMIYVGDHPEKVQPRSTTVAGTLFGKNVTWSQEKSGEKDGRFFQEVLVSIPGGNGYVHVMIYAGSQDELKLLQRAAETLRIERAVKKNESTANVHARCPGSSCFDQPDGADHRGRPEREEDSRSAGAHEGRHRVLGRFSSAGEGL